MHQVPAIHQPTAPATSWHSWADRQPPRGREALPATSRASERSADSLPYASQGLRGVWG